VYQRVRGAAHAAIRRVDAKVAIRERAVGVGGRAELRVRITARLVESDADRFVRPPSFPHQRDDVAGRVVGLVAPQRGVVEGFRGCERTLSAVETAAHEKDTEVWLHEEVRAEKLAGDDGRADL